VVPVLSERFADWDDFRAHVQVLYDWIMARSPFCEPALRAALAVELCFWSDPQGGLFRTDASQSQGAASSMAIEPWPSRCSIPYIRAARVFD